MVDGWVDGWWMDGRWMGGGWMMNKWMKDKWVNKQMHRWMDVYISCKNSFIHTKKIPGCTLRRLSRAVHLE